MNRVSSEILGTMSERENQTGRSADPEGEGRTSERIIR